LRSLLVILLLLISCYVFTDDSYQVTGIETQNQDLDDATTSALGHLFNDEEEARPLTPPTFGFMMMQMLGMLLFISVCLYLALYFFKRVNARYKNKNEAICFKIHENVYFSTKQGLSAVSFGNKLYIVGFCPNSINLIDVVDDQETISKLTEMPAPHKKFTDLFKGFVSSNTANSRREQRET